MPPASRSDRQSDEEERQFIADVSDPIANLLEDSTQIITAWEALGVPGSGPEDNLRIIREHLVTLQRSARRDHSSHKRSRPWQCATRR
jgi:hypothetical protein